MDCLKDTFREVLDVYLQVLQSPAFASDKLDVAKVQATAGIARRNDNVGAIAARETSRLVYGADSPLGRVEEYATIAAVTRDDLAAWHKRYYTPNRTSLGVVGDFDPSVMRKTIESAFGSWGKGPEFADPEPQVRKNSAPGVYFVESV